VRPQDFLGHDSDDDFAEETADETLRQVPKFNAFISSVLYVSPSTTLQALLDELGDKAAVNDDDDF
jgi:hypothetical protein